jgi:hypothetical protein
VTEELKKILEKEEERLINALPKVDAINQAETYNVILNNLTAVRYHIGELDEEELEENSHVIGVTPQEPSTEEFHPPVMLPEEPEEEEPEEEDPAPVPTYSREEVRAALAKARKTGLNVTELLSEYGVDNFSALPAGKYAEIMERIS